MNMIQQPYDPWAVASNPPEETFATFGEISINAWPCMLVSGVGKMPYDDKVLDPTTGKEYRRYTAVELSIMPLPETGASYEVRRSMLAEFGEWRDITWPSLKALGVLSAQEINDKYAQIELVPTGRTYTSQAGETKNATAIRFMALYDNREACLAAYRSNAPQSSFPSSDNGNGKERETALKFAKVLVGNAMRNANKDVEKARAMLMSMLAGQPLVNKYFTVDSPEIVELIVAET
jgi:hypothetical protein